MSGLWWPKPEAGDIVWSHFPHLPRLVPGPKPRPALVVRVMERTPQTGFRVLVAYGTSQKLSSLRCGEFAIRKDASQAFKLSGVSFDSKFSFTTCVELDYSDTWFQVPPNAPHGQCPKLGVLHAVYAKAAYAAYQASGF